MDGSRPKLLLADDSVTIRRVVELTFADEGIDVSTAVDSASLMHKFVEIQPDIVLVDIGLEGTNGYRICEMIKNDETTKHLPVLLLVGSFEPFDQDEAERVRADGFLTKPFQSIRDLVARVSDLLGRDNNAESAAVEEADKPAAGMTADIDNLYVSSFAVTAEIDEFDTAEDILGDSGMDDEMIETTYPSEAFEEDILAFEPEMEPSEQVQEFDWSSESRVMETKPVANEATAFEPKIEESHHKENSVAEPEAADARTFEDVPAIAKDNGPAEPSPEFISLIAQRVVERLSDRVIREIAQDAVPRIAEKLIREALEEDKKQ